jgi:hypothetical protein
MDQPLADLGRFATLVGLADVDLEVLVILKTETCSSLAEKHIKQQRKVK